MDGRDAPRSRKQRELEFVQGCFGNSNQSQAVAFYHPHSTINLNISYLQDMSKEPHNLRYDITNWDISIDYVIFETQQSEVNLCKQSYSSPPICGNVFGNYPRDTLGVHSVAVVAALRDEYRNRGYKLGERSLWSVDGKHVMFTEIGTQESRDERSLLGNELSWYDSPVEKTGAFWTYWTGSKFSGRDASLAIVEVINEALEAKQI